MHAGEARPLRLVQFSDCHVHGDPDERYRGVDSRRTFIECLSMIAEYQPDLLIGTGDLSEDYSEASYRFLADQLAETGISYLTLPGNHDTAPLQRQVLGQCPVEQAVFHDFGTWRLVLLNSAVDGEVPGTLSDVMLGSLEQALRAWNGPKAVFLHHLFLSEQFSADHSALWLTFYSQDIQHPAVHMRQLVLVHS